LQPSVSQQDQHAMVSNTLGDLMTPVLPPVYRLFMSGIVFNKQLGPWFYAPFLTSIVTPPLFRFLVGPSRPNRRLDGAWGGLVVEKCRFLQLSNCKGLCLHQCKLPAQQFFANELGMPLTVAPNFETQECQWSFGQVPVPVQDDPSFPKGCLVGCQSRKLLGGAAAGQTSDLCSSL
jgi:beta-carotene isomerase